jgi:hypothetical protein
VLASAIRHHLRGGDISLDKCKADAPLIVAESLRHRACSLELASLFMRVRQDRISSSNPASEVGSKRPTAIDRWS